MKKFIAVFLSALVLMTFAFFAIGSSSEDATVESGGEQSQDVSDLQNAETGDLSIKVGETLKANDLSIKYVSCEEYTDYNQYLPPKDGNKIIKLNFEVENTGTTDRYISNFEFSCYADNKATEAYYTDNDLSATISSGRSASGSVCFEVPENAEEIEVEYETDFWTDGKAVFVVEL